MTDTPKIVPTEVEEPVAVVETPDVVGPVAETRPVAVPVDAPK